MFSVKILDDTRIKWQDRFYCGRESSLWALFTGGLPWHCHTNTKAGLSLCIRS